jgi:L-lysine exporter family protein LysE/ArgO
MHEAIPVFIQGFFTSAALIIAIGAQNAFVLRQGIKREHVFVVALICALSDALLIALGVAGLGTLVQANPVLLSIARYGGAAFLFTYGVFAAQRVWRAGRGKGVALSAMATTAFDGTQPLSMRAAVLACLAFTYLNPHCYLDTVVLLGSISAQFEGALRWTFGAGAVAASIVWFFALAYGARALAPLFARSVAWRVLDAIIAIVMWLIAVALLLQR